MRARAVWGGMVASTAVLIIGWQLGTAGAQPTTEPRSMGATAPAHRYDGSAASGDSASAPPAQRSRSFTGSVSSTPYGDVQVKITVRAGSLADVTPLHLTDRNQRSVSISNRAAPILRSEVLSAQSSHVHAVSGATYTSEGYLSSLQSALDESGL